MGTIDEDAVRAALLTVDDPEAGMNIVDLGLVYGLDVGEGGVHIELTMTSAACPMAELIVDQVHDAVREVVPAGTAVAIDLVWDPPWTPERMSEVARTHFGWTPSSR